MSSETILKFSREYKTPDYSYKPQLIIEHPELTIIKRRAEGRIGDRLRKYLEERDRLEREGVLIIKFPIE